MCFPHFVSTACLNRNIKLEEVCLEQSRKALSSVGNKTAFNRIQSIVFARLKSSTLSLSYHELVSTFHLFFFGFIVLLFSLFDVLSLCVTTCLYSRIDAASRWIFLPHAWRISLIRRAIQRISSGQPFNFEPSALTITYAVFCICKVRLILSVNMVNRISLISDGLTN